MINDFILVEFYVKNTEELNLLFELQDLGIDFVKIKSELEWDYEDDYAKAEPMVRISGKINSMCATRLKLQKSPLLESMHVSYIDSDLKDRYRK